MSPEICKYKPHTGIEHSIVFQAICAFNHLIYFHKSSHISLIHSLSHTHPSTPYKAKRWLFPAYTLNDIRACLYRANLSACSRASMACMLYPIPSAMWERAMNGWLFPISIAFFDQLTPSWYCKKEINSLHQFKQNSQRIKTVSAKQRPQFYTNNMFFGNKWGQQTKTVLATSTNLV